MKIAMLLLFLSGCASMHKPTQFGCVPAIWGITLEGGPPRLINKWGDKDRVLQVCFWSDGSMRWEWPKTEPKK